MLYFHRTSHWEVKKMFNQRKKNKYNTLLAYLMVNFLTQKIFEELRDNRRDFWDFLDHKTMETLKINTFRWNKKSLITATQDFLDIHAGRTTRELHGTREINKNPYFFEILTLFDIKVTHNQKKNGRKKLEKLIYKKIKS